MNSIFINSSPNTGIDDVFFALRELMLPWRWRNGSLVRKFESEIEKYFGEGVYACAFDSARSSFYQILKSWNVSTGDEVIVPAFTCTVIVNPVLWVGAKPVYVDIKKDTLNMNISEVERKITTKTKVILVQHTFGYPIEMEKVMELAKKHNLKVVEDCAHSLGIKYKGQYLGTFGDASVITFGITKVISGVRGGMAITKDTGLLSELKSRQYKLPPFPILHTKKFLLNPIIWYLVIPVYYLGFGKFTLGKLIIFILQKIGILGIDNIVEKCEEYGEKPGWLPTRMSGSLSVLARHQFGKLSKLNEHRAKIAKVYSKELGIPFYSDSLNLRIPVYVRDKSEALDFFRKRRIMLGDWYKNILHIPKKNYVKLFYTEGECPNAEYATQNTVNLPAFIKVTEEDAREISKLVKPFIDYSYYEK